YLDHAAVQKVVGADVDGKIGVGTVKAIKAWQRANGLEADGKVGAATKAKMGLSGKGSGAPPPSAPAPTAPSSDGDKLTLVDLPEVETGKTSPNKNTDRRGHEVQHITVHWWGNPSGQSFDGIVDWLCDKRAKVSAHYVINAGRVARIVDESHRSWANGNADANSQAITIECDPNDVRGTLPVLAALVKDIRSRWGDLPIYPHSKWTSTQCPGDYLPHLGAVDELARTGEAVVSPGKPAPAPSRKVAEDGRFGRETVTALQTLLGVTADGRAGENTWKALQKRLGTPVDGVVSHQSYKATELGNGVVPRAWKYTGRGSKGSTMVVALQKRLGVKAEGIWYEGTTKALQRKLNTGTKWSGGGVMLSSPYPVRELASYRLFMVAGWRAGIAGGLWVIINPPQTYEGIGLTLTTTWGAFLVAGGALVAIGHAARKYKIEIPGLLLSLGGVVIYDYLRSEEHTSELQSRFIL